MAMILAEVDLKPTIGASGSSARLRLPGLGDVVRPVVYAPAALASSDLRTLVSEMASLEPGTEDTDKSWLPIVRESEEGLLLHS
jgi:hypothetical protein